MAMSSTCLPARTAAAAPRRAPAAAVVRVRPSSLSAAPLRAPRRAVSARVASGDEQPEEMPSMSGAPAPATVDIRTAAQKLLQRYDFVSTGMGALVVTGFFWANGQDPMHALSITFSSTVFGVVANELLFNNNS